MNIGINEAIEHFFSNPSFELIYLEAVANALDAGARKINIYISLESYKHPNTLEIEIEDNGDGFNDYNFRKFSSLLSKTDKNHKGLGRLVYLHYFNNVEISSIYDKNKKRTFNFNKNFNGEYEETTLNNEQDNYSRLKFSSFANKDLKSYDNVRSSSIKKILLKHFMPRFFAMKQINEDFEIIIETDVTEENRDKHFYSDIQTIKLDDLPDLEEKIISDTHIDLFNESFTILYSLKDSYDEKISTSICVDNRAIDFPILKNETIPGNISGVFLLISEFFNSKSDDSRQELKIENYEKKIIEKMFLKAISEILNEKYPAIKDENEKMSKKLTNRYPHLEGYFSSNYVALIDENKSLDEAKNKFFKEQKEILGANKITDSIYELSLNHATRTLTEYILYRNIIIDKLQKTTGENKEATIHNLIVPMKNTLSAKNFIQDLYNNNAWILDDKYMSYQHILSDQNINELISQISDDKELQFDDLRPDIAFVFSENIDTSKHPVDVVIVELKKKQLDYLALNSSFDSSGRFES